MPTRVEQNSNVGLCGWLRITVFAITCGSIPVYLHTNALAADLKVVEFKCASSVQNAEPVGIIDCASAQLPSPVVVWVRLRGDASTLDMLGAQQRLTVRHKWQRRIGPRPEIETLTAEDIGAGAIKPEIMDLLAIEVRERGYFDWRTWTIKRNLRATHYSVEVADQSFQMLPCTGQASCPIKIRVE